MDSIDCGVRGAQLFGIRKQIMPRSLCETHSQTVETDGCQAVSDISLQFETIYQPSISTNCSEKELLTINHTEESVPVSQFQAMEITEKADVERSSEWSSGKDAARDVENSIILSDTSSSSVFSFDHFLETQTLSFSLEEQSVSNRSSDTILEISPEEYLERLKRTRFYCTVHPSEGDSLLHSVIISGNEDLALAMINDMVTYEYLSEKNKHLQTALHLAVIVNMPRVVRSLMSHGAPVDTRDAQGNTPLHLACRQGKEECVEMLTKHLVYQEVKNIPYSVPFRLIPHNLELRNYEGMTCLHLAVEGNHINIVHFLVSSMYVDTDTQEGKSGKSALHIAVEKHNLKMVLYLIQNCKAKVNCEMFDGRTPLDIAQESGNYELINILRCFGGRSRCDGFEDYYRNEQDFDDL